MADGEVADQSTARYSDGKLTEKSGHDRRRRQENQVTHDGRNPGAGHQT